MKKDIGYFIDIERLIKWIHANRELVKELLWDKGNTEEPNRIKKWKRYENFLSDYYLGLINDSLAEKEKKFEKINIAELMVCINNAKDHNRGNRHSELSPITSTGKKVMTMLLLGRIIDWAGEDGCFQTTEDNHPEVFAYLASFSSRPKKNGKYYYFPGRTVSYNQLCEFSKDYKNGITSRGIYGGLMRLVDIGLVECVDKEKELYKLSFEGCKKFLEKNK